MSIYIIVKVFRLSILEVLFGFLPMSIDIPCPPYVISNPILWSCCLSVNSYSYPTDVIVTFHSLSVSRATIGGYSNIVLIMSIHTFFFSKKMVYSLFVLTFMANVSNSIMKSAVFFFSCLKVSIFHLASAALVLSLNVILISCTSLSQSWVFVSLSSLSSFF